jgi:hypothetical protein
MERGQFGLETEETEEHAAVGSRLEKLYAASRSACSMMQIKQPDQTR